jgi:hypothetical protein
MPRVQTTEAWHAINAPTSSDPFVILLEVTEAHGEQTLRYARGFESITFEDSNYSARAMQYSRPSEGDVSGAVGKLTIDNVDQALTDAYLWNAELPMRACVILRSTLFLSVPWVSFKFRNGVLSATQVNGELHKNSAEDETAPGRRMTPLTFPGLFKPREFDEV